MKEKLIRIFLAFVVALPMFTSVLAISSEDLLDRLESIQETIKDIKDEYEEQIDAYPDVINSLSAESKATITDLLNGKILEEGIKERIDALKTELKASEVEGANKVLESTEAVVDSFDAMIKENKDVVEEVKAGYADLEIDEIKAVVEKATDILESLGVDTDVSDTYDKTMRILEESHGMATDITVRLESIIPNYVATFESAFTKELVKELLTEVKAKDREAVIDTLIEALNDANGGKELKGHLKEVKTIAVKLKDKLMELDTLNEQDLLMFTDAQKKGVSDKIKAIEKDYIDFAKAVLDSSSEAYMDVVVDLAYDTEVDTMIKYANEALDYYAQYKDTVKSLTAKDVVDRLELPEELIEKAGLMVALGFIDTTDYNKAYVEKHFGTQIENMKEYIANECVDYLDHIDATINGEVTDTYTNGTDSETTQKELRAITAARFKTIADLKALKTRVDTELLKDKEDIKSDLAKVANYVYDMYNENILMSTEATLMKENDDPNRKYESTYMDSYIITNIFMKSSEFAKELGIPEEYQSVLKYSNLTNNKIRTGSALTIELSDTVIGTYGFVVLGDVFVDGKVDSRDYMVIKNYIMEDETLSKVRQLASDTYRDKLIDSRDYMVIKNYIMDGKKISL